MRRALRKQQPRWLAATMACWAWHSLALDDSRWGPGAGLWERSAARWPANESLTEGAEKLWREFPGRRCLVVVHEGKVAYERYAAGASPEERLEADSAAKTVCALLVGVLVTQGKLDLDMPLARYNVTPHAYWGKDKVFWPLVTTRHLLSHTSGLGQEPPGQSFVYDSGQHIQHLSSLIAKRTSPPEGKWATPVEWAEEVFLKPLGLSGLFDHDGLAGHISIGGGQMMSCQQLARVGQLLLNRGWWPIFGAPSWPWLPWEGDTTSFTRVISDDYLAQMTRPSFPSVVSTYGFLVWLNRAPQPGDSSCCMCTCGVCVGVPEPPILGSNVHEEAWISLGYLTKYMIVLPRRNASIVSLGMDIPGSKACSVAMSWAAFTYDDAFGALLHFRILRASLPTPDSTGTTTSSTTTTTISTTTLPSTTSTTTQPSTTSTSLVLLRGTETLTTASASTSSTLALLVPISQTTLAHGTITTEMVTMLAPSGEMAIEGGLTSTYSISTTTRNSFDPFAHVYGYGQHKVSPVRKSRGVQDQRLHVQKGGSCTCSCPIDEDFGRCFNLPETVVVPDWRKGKQVCEHFAQGYQEMVRLQNGSGGCFNMGIVQKCESNTWFIGGGTRGICDSWQWSDMYGLECHVISPCGAAADNDTNSTSSKSGWNVSMDTDITTCSCRVTRWKCSYGQEPCNRGDPYYPVAPDFIVRELLKLKTVRVRHYNFKLALVSVFSAVGAACVTTAFCTIVRCCRRARRTATAAEAGAQDYRRMPGPP